MYSIVSKTIEDINLSHAIEAIKDTIKNNFFSKFSFS